MFKKCIFSKDFCRSVGEPAICCQLALLVKVFEYPTIRLKCMLFTAIQTHTHTPNDLVLMVCSCVYFQALQINEFTDLVFCHGLNISTIPPGLA